MRKTPYLIEFLKLDYPNKVGYKNILLHLSFRSDVRISGIEMQKHVKEWFEAMCDDYGHHPTLQGEMQELFKEYFPEIDFTGCLGYTWKV